MPKKMVPYRIRYPFVVSSVALAAAAWLGQPVYGYTPQSPQVQEMVRKAVAYLETKSQGPGRGFYDKLGGTCITALAILKLSSPFDPFPRELHERHDSLRFAYEWQFIAGELVQSTVRAPATP